MCELYWKLVELGVEVLGGLTGWARVFGCNVDMGCDCDVVVAESDAEKIQPTPCLWTIDKPGFSHRRVWIGGLPHISLEDLPRVKSPYTQAVLECIRDALRRREGVDRPRREI